MGERTLTTLAAKGGRQEASLPETKCSKGRSKKPASGNTATQPFPSGQYSTGQLKSGPLQVPPKPVNVRQCSRAR